MKKQNKEDIVFLIIFVFFAIIGFGASILDTIKN